MRIDVYKEREKSRMHRWRKNWGYVCAAHDAPELFPDNYSSISGSTIRELVDKLKTHGLAQICIQATFLTGNHNEISPNGSRVVQRAPLNADELAGFYSEIARAFNSF